ncbi:unnamed protein product [Brachionus calyciflorus]|uniref:Reverse transcriptase domain-containing protein n=1 Tax=Brachionus calyciflorus TaxID=104777 RepID=A0A814M755_9BILA|nr:unnamed protein product [Brachionus calyciflorus]
MIKKGGGVALGVANSIRCKEIDFSKFSNNLSNQDEIVGIELDLFTGDTLAIISMYTSPKAQINSQLFEDIIKIFKNLIILQKIVEDHNLFVLNNEKPTFTRSNNILDLTICSSAMLKYFNDFKVLNHTISDHYPTLTTFGNLLPAREQKIAKKIDWNKFRTFLENDEIIECKLLRSADMDEAVTKLIKQIKSAIEKATNTFNLSTQAKYFMPIPQQLLELVRQKRKMRRIFNKSQLPEHKKALNRINYHLSKTLKKFKAEKIKNEFIELSKFNQNDTKHWRLINNLEKHEIINRTIPKLTINNRKIDCQKEIAEAFANNLANIFTELNPNRFEKTTVQESISFNRNEYISTSELTEAIKKIKNKNSTGFDNISNKFLKNLPFRTLLSIHSIFNASLKLGHIPDEWKKAKVVMTLKKGKPPDDPNSYRPISLLCCLGKLLEKIVNKKLQDWAELNKLLPDCQAGFRRGRSTQEQIFRIVQSICHGFNEKKLTGAIFFDLEKAFDITHHKGICKKLKDLGLNPTILRWIISFLSNRTFKVAINETLSSTKEIHCGVPQGSCLSPTLFIILFSDIAKNLPENIKVALFADDLCIWYSEKSIEKIESNLQTAINKIIEFCTFWGFKVNHSKTCYTTFTTAGKRKNYETKYKLTVKINDEEIPLDPKPAFLDLNQQNSQGPKTRQNRRKSKSSFLKIYKK